ncbi:unnamed protein product [Calypogeia fissa]
MARAGLLHVTVIAATLLRDGAGGSSSELAETYASVGCGSQNFTTTSVKNHRAKPAWNETCTFKFDERSELEAQHILIEIFAEKPKLDELLGLAKIPLQTVVTAGDEISTHSLNRPDDEYTGHEQYSGHVKVALRWDSAQRIAPAYPKTYSPAARYNPNETVTRTRTVSGQASRPEEQLRASKPDHELHNAENIHVPGQDQRVHHRSSSCPPPLHGFQSSAPSPSQSPWKPSLKVDDISTSQEQFSFVLPPTAHPSARPRHSSFEAPSNAFLKPEHHGPGSSPHGPYAGPHVPYVCHQGNKGDEEVCFNGHAVPVQPTEFGLGNSNLKAQDDVAKGKLSKSKQAEMMKLVELSKLTEVAKIQATGLAKAGQQPPPRPKQRIVHTHQQSQVSPLPKTTSNALLSQHNHVPEKQRNDVAEVQQQTPNPREVQKHFVQHLSNRPQWSNAQSQELTVVPTMLDLVEHQPRKQQKDHGKPHKTFVTPQHRADTVYQKAIQKAEKPEQQKKLSPFRQTLKILRKTAKIFGI